MTKQGTAFDQVSPEKQLTYAAYLQLTADLLARNKTTGPDQSEAKIEYTRLNLHRMNKWNKVGKLSDKMQQCLQDLKTHQTWYLLSEPWCGDSAQSLPFIALIAEASKGKIELKILLRDENPEIMDLYLSNGSRSIPKLIAVDNNGNDLFTWGPYPQKTDAMRMEWKMDESLDPEMRKEKLHKWYAENRGEALQEEMAALLSN